MRRQTTLDLRHKLIADVSAENDLRRQLILLNDILIPRAESIVAIRQAEYEGGRASLNDFVESKRAILALRRLKANVQISQCQRLLDIDSIVGQIAP
jgi:hypothetical protein